MLVAKLGEYISRTKSMKTREGNAPTRFDRSLKMPSFISVLVPPPTYPSVSNRSRATEPSSQTVTND